jgi:hypothetical protein
MDEAGYSLVILPVEECVKDAVHRAAKHLNKKYGMPITKVRFIDTCIITVLSFSTSALYTINAVHNSMNGCMLQSNSERIQTEALFNCINVYEL